MTNPEENRLSVVFEKGGFKKSEKSFLGLFKETRLEKEYHGRLFSVSQFNANGSRSLSLDLCVKLTTKITGNTLMVNLDSANERDKYNLNGVFNKLISLGPFNLKHGPNIRVDPVTKNAFIYLPSKNLNDSNLETALEILCDYIAILRM